MARQDTASEPPGHARLMVTIMMVFVVNATLYYVLPSLMADVGYLLLTSVLGLSLDGKYFEDPRYFAAAAYLGFLVLPSCGALFSAGATLLLTLRRLVHLFLKILGRPRPFDIEKPKVFGSVLFLAAVLTYYTIGCCQTDSNQSQFPANSVNLPGTELTPLCESGGTVELEVLS